MGTAFALLAVGCDTQGSRSPDSRSISPPSARQTTVALAWRDVGVPLNVASFRAAGVIADPDGFVVYGQVDFDAAVAVSPDGMTWQLIALPGAEGSPTRAASSVDATVLIGGGGTERCAHPFGEFLWRREHGIAEWLAVPFDESLFCAGGSAAIAAQADEFMVAGMGAGDQPFAWRSADGLIWTDAVAGIPTELPPWALAASDDLFVELGRGSVTDVRVTTGDEAWSIAAAPPVPPAFDAGSAGAEPVALFATGRGLIAVYSSNDGRTVSTFLRAQDGAWSPVALDGVSAGGGVSGGTAMLGLPYLFTKAGAGEPAALLTSPDLSSWSRLPIPGLDSIAGVATDGERTIVVGWNLDASGDEERSVVRIVDGLPGR